MQSADDNDGSDDLINASFMKNLSKEEKREALAAAAAAQRAEKRAEERAIARALEKRQKEREEMRKKQFEKMNEWRDKVGKEDGGGGGGGKERSGGSDSVGNGGGENHNGASNGNNDVNGKKVVFMSKKQREAMKKRELEEKSNPPAKKTSSTSSTSKRTSSTNRGGGSSKKSRHNSQTSSSRSPRSSSSKSNNPHHLSKAELMQVKKNYLGANAATSISTAEERRRQLELKAKKRAQKKITFKFEWDESDDTSNLGVDPLFDSTVRRVSGPRNTARNARSNLSRQPVLTVDSVTTKPIQNMTARDWRIFRENYDIRVRGGKAPPPLRTFSENSDGVSKIHPALLDAIKHVLKYTDPSPIQRQAIPIGLQRRDLIGIAETGSGKTAAFGIPLCHHILSLPNDILDTVDEKGPLALVMAPTRELALQIDVEIEKLLSKRSDVTTLAVVGGQSIQSQANKLREGVHVVVGTPGRINDCVETAYLVLNQCSYIVLDEADRMIDLGFAPQIEQILDSMGGLLKSEDESMAYQQELEDMKRLGQVVPRHRLTAMFSATMPPEVERIAKNYLRHPAIVSIGDQDSSKNNRITQRVLYLSSHAQKEKTLREILHRSSIQEKIIVFVNEKKHADGVGRMVENAGRKCVVLHGGKTQEQREENLGSFRCGGVVLVATDVAGRGLDIPNVSHIINFDLPSRSIDNYCHRIGRTGRAGKEGIATSFMTDADEGIMAPLKHYLENTNSQVPDKLARHPAASGVVGGNIR